MKSTPKIIILSGYGLNCEEETAFAFELAGGQAEIVHINDLIAKKNKLMNYQILSLPGGFSYGDDIGSGKAYANKLKNHLNDALHHFANNDKLIIGICNGFQILTQTGLLPGALIFNDFPRYTVRWVDLRIPPLDVKNKGRRSLASPWLSGIRHFSLPIAHGEGKFFADDDTLAIMKKQGQIAAFYTKGEICKYQDLKTYNPNGSLMDIAGITNYDGRVLGLMPHPERAIFFTQLPHWPLLKQKLMRKNQPLPKFGPGLQIFKNAINYFKH